jgi:threonine/homoserine/homoserine lactone efflux protein
MTLEYAVAFAIGMLLWTALPGPGLAVVVSRALGSGPRAGFAVVTGLVIADFIFLGIAFIGLLAIATTMGPMFQVVKYAGAAYLIWRGYQVIVGAEGKMAVQAGVSGALWRDISLGVLATLGNPKAILFFGAILPTFIDMTAVAVADFLVLAGIVAGVSYLVYGCCIILADRTRHLMASTKAAKRLRKLTGTILIGSGVVVATR